MSVPDLTQDVRTTHIQSNVPFIFSMFDFPKYMNFNLFKNSK